MNALSAGRCVTVMVKTTCSRHHLIALARLKTMTDVMMRMTTVIELNKATRHEACQLASLLEPLARPYGFHIGLGGGTLHQDGFRKDIDILIYRRRIDIVQGHLFPVEDLFKAFEAAGLKRVKLNSRPDMWCTKCKWKGIPVDVLYPEAVETGTYNSDGEHVQENPADEFKLGEFQLVPRPIDTEMEFW